jgi:CHAT domain-containing protein
MEDLLQKNEEELRTCIANLGEEAVAELFKQAWDTIRQAHLHGGQARTTASSEKLALARKAIAIASYSGSEPLLAEAHRMMAYVLNANEDYEESLEHYAKAVDGLEKSGAREKASRARIGYVAALFMTGRYQEAIENAKVADRFFLKTKDLDGHARLSANLGNLYHRLDEHARALTYQSKAIKLFRKLKNAPALALCYLNLAESLSILDRFEESDRIFERSQKLSRKHALNDLYIQAKYNRSYLSFLRGHYSEAIQGFTELQEQYNREGSLRHSALCDLDQAEIYIHLNLTGDAVTFSKRAADTFRQLGMRYEQAKATAFLGFAVTHNRQYSEALEIFRESQEIFEQEKNHYWVASLELYRAQVYFLIGRFWESRSMCLSAHDRFSRLNTPSKRAMALVMLSRTALELGAVDEAAGYGDQILQLMQETPIPLHLFPCYSVNAQIAEYRGDLKKAQKFYTQAAEEIEIQRSHLHHDELRVTFFRGKQRVYEALVRIALGGRDHEGLVDAYNWCERSKSRGLVDLLSQHLPAAHAQADQSLLNRIERLHEELNSYSIRSDASSHGRAMANADDIAIKKSELVRRLKELSTQDPEYVSLQKVSVLSIEHVQQVLPEDHTLVEYFVARDEILAFLISKDGASVQRHLCTVARIQHLHERLRLQMDKFLIGGDYVQEYATPLLKAANQHLQELYTELIMPFASAIKGRHLIIVPHGPLHYIPFHALYDGTQYLVDGFTISYAPSASVLRYCIDRESVPNATPLIVGVPDENAPLIEHEVQSLRKLVPDCRTLSGKRATRRAFQREAAEADFIHVATHAVFRSDNPMFSSFKVADGWITALDLYSMKCNANLIVLSGCKSGMNQLMGADELLGLTRGFLYSGARSLLLSLWDVNDKSTSRFMTEFYQSWLGGQTKSAALRIAIQKIRAEESHPYFWAPFLLIGNP